MRQTATAVRCAALLGLLVYCSSSLALDRNALFDEANLLLLPRERQLPNLEFVDEHGQAVTTDSLRGRWHLLFFGFTACPDICPTTLSDMRRLFGQLPSSVSDQIQLILVSADPARDTPETLRTYLGYYRAGFKGWTGDIAQLQKLSKALGLPFVPVDKTEGEYSVSHSGNLAIVSPDGKLRGHIRSPLRLDGLRHALPQLIEAE
ncbi:SCO family protein [Stutzerimonas stutzeri]|uniref:SCO family protein n=1 Tax=Stutzerimonas stutzeri TaxID=316 RepID=UPI000571F209|nr:SCO family protein [Stutzerimonas stutzeri]MCQ4328297.1 SCO family protein [Stutzerimonas stutzeri]